MRLKHTILLFILLYNITLFAQKKETTKPVPKAKKEKKVKPPPENIEFFPNKTMFKVKFLHPTVSINVSNRRSGDGKKFKYLPAMPGVVGFAFKIKKVYVSAAIQLPPSDDLKKKYGESKFRNININIRGRYVEWGLFYRDYKGFYLDNYKDFYPAWNRDSLGYPSTKGLRIIEGGLNVGFNFNKSFSMNAAFSQGERQKKSAGSFLLGISERYQRINADSSFVPKGQESFYPNLDKLKYGNFVTTLIAAGVGYQIVVKKFHFTPVLMAGSGIQFQSYRQTDRKRYRFNIPTYAQARAQLGYNGDHFFTNLIYQTEFNSIPIKESRIRLFHDWIEIGMGVRF